MGHIFLYGPSGAGKSTIAKILAYNLKLPFVDSDLIIEINAGMSISKIMEEQGMTKVRELETSALRQIINGEESVIALGGGALLRRENRALVENSGNVVLLVAALDTLLERLQNDSHKRPLLEGDLKLQLTSYLDGRAEHYASFPQKVYVDGKSMEHIVHQIQVVLGRYHLSKMGEYDVIIGQVSDLAHFPLQKPLIVTDENVAKFHLKKIKSVLLSSGAEPKSVIIPAGEEYKNLETVSRLWKSFLEHGLDRNSTVIAFGGGVIGDLVGFAASTYMRGINWIGLPTTLLSMVDASLGGKTGFDLPEGKNLIGSFHPPKLVLADPQWLQTLPEREFCSGMAEVVKHGVISDPALFAQCSRGLDWVKANLEEIVKSAMAVKIRIIEEDPYEKGIRATLNVGHTVGHAVELVSKFELRHGEAIAMGTVVEARYAERIGLAERGLTETLTKTFTQLGLPVQIPPEMPRAEIIGAMRVDKKKDSNVIRFALPIAIGKVELVEVRDLEDVIQ